MNKYYFSKSDINYLKRIVLENKKKNLISVILLIGPLGAGKTLFTKLFLQEFFISDVKSPTFIYYLKYNSNKFKLSFIHFDLYLLKNKNLNSFLFLNELIDNNDISIFEWGNILPLNFLNEKYKKIIKIIFKNKTIQILKGH